MEMFLNLAKGKEELKMLLNGNLTKKHPENHKDDQLEQLQAEMERRRTHMNGQMALIQSLAREQEELRILISKLHQDKYDRLGQTARIWGLANDQHLLAEGNWVTCSCGNMLKIHSGAVKFRGLHL